MNFNSCKNKSKEELLAMQQAFLSRKSKIQELYYNTKVISATDPNLKRRIRLSRVLGHINGSIGTIDQFLGVDKSLEKFKISNSKKLRGARKQHNLEKFQQLLLLKRPKDSTLPKILIGNAVLYELPLSDLIKFKNHHRLRVFNEKGLYCNHPQCKLKGARLLVTLDVSGNEHIDLFTKDLHHINVDHIIPSSKGGSDNISNLQPSCAYHNSKKGNKLTW